MGKIANTKEARRKGAAAKKKGKLLKIIKH